MITPEQLAKSGSEDGNQMALFCQAALHAKQYPQLKWLHAIPNGGSRHIAEAGKLVAMGIKSGVWDIFLPVPMQTQWAKMYAGLYIEMKRAKYKTAKDGGLSIDQLEFGQYAENMGYFCAVCYSWQEAWDVIIKYLKGE